MLPFEVRPYRTGDDQAILDLFNEVFGEDNPEFTPRTLDQWRWEFLDNPAGTTIFVGEAADGHIISQYACLPTFAYLEGERVTAIQGIDSVVHRDYRKGLRKEGAFLATARAFFETWGIAERNAFGWGFPNQRVFRIGVKLLGYQPLDQPVPGLFRNLFAHASDDDVARGQADEVAVEELDRFDGRADALFERLAAENPIAIFRDQAYLNWRYTDCRLASYRAFAIVDASSELRALTVTRSNWQGLPILAVTEWMVGEQDLGASGALLRHVLALAREEEQQRVEMWQAPRSPHFQTLLDMGLESEPGYYNLCVMPYRADLDLERFRKGFRYTIGDVDVF